jgi:hypothetical protein
MILRSEIVKTTCRSEAYSVAEGGKRLFMALRTKSKFEADVFFIDFAKRNRENDVSLRRISAAGGKILFTQLPNPRLFMALRAKSKFEADVFS